MTKIEFTPEEIKNEIWEPVPTWESLYAISDRGRLWSEHRGGRLLSPNPANWYPAVKLCDGNRREKIFVHQIVAAVFIGPCPLGYEVNHKDLTRNNNRVENLEYITHGDNVRHAASMGAMVQGDDHWTRRTPERIKQGVECFLSKWSEADIELVRTAVEPLAKVAERIGMDLSNAYRIRRGETWKHLPHEAKSAKTHPPVYHRGDAHHARLHPETVARGESHGGAILTDSDVLAIRASEESAEIVGPRFRVRPCTVYDIRAGRSWKHLL